MSRLTKRVKCNVPTIVLKMLGIEDVPTESVEIIKTDSEPCDSVCEQYEYECSECPINEAFVKLAHYEDLEEQGRLTDWKRTSEEKPDSTRHLIAAYGEIISHYGYYLKPKDKWFTDWTCEKEMDEPMFWTDMPEPPKESLYTECCAKMEVAE